MSLRVITGLRKGHKLRGPKDDLARPTEDRMKESVFNTLTPFEKDFIVLDLFAATGNIGIEFLSRGAKKAYFSERDKNNIKNLKWNLEHTKFTNESVILEGDFKRNILLIRDNIDYVYIDPPYESNYYEEAFNLLLDNKYFKDALFIVETNKDVNFSLIFDELELLNEKKYGKKYIRYYRKRNESSISG